MIVNSVSNSRRDALENPFAAQLVCNLQVDLSGNLALEKWKIRNFYGSRVASNKCNSAYTKAKAENFSKYRESSDGRKGGPCSRKSAAAEVKKRFKALGMPVAVAQRPTSS